jgi:putative transcriptional regulator
MVTSLGVLAPGMLIASPPLGDPNFDRSVVLLAAHGAEGALGFVVNRTAKVTRGQLLARAGYKDASGDASRVYIGGPVQPSSGWIVSVESEDTAAESGVISVGERIRVSSSRRAFDALARHVETRGSDATDPQKRMVMLGYSGWGPGQLEDEIAAGAWLPVQLDEEVLFDVALDAKWERAYALLDLLPAGMMGSHFIGEA